MQRNKALWMAIAFLVFWWGIGSFDAIGRYIDGTHRTAPAGARHAAGALPALAALRGGAGDRRDADELRAEIRRRAERENVPAVDARIDPVWRAIPGLKGLRVDEEATFRLALARADGEIPLVYEETAPQISLDDLPPEPIYKGNPGKPMAAIMINVAWGDEYLPSILETLRKENVKATFFLDGTWLSKHRDTALQLLKEGHELSNHAYTHPDMSRLSRAEADREIVRTERELAELGVRNRLFAPPSGDFDKETVRIAREHGLRTVLWTVDTVDWKHPPSERIVAKIARDAEPGALILMHPTDSASAALPGMIRAIKNKGLVLGTVSELISDERVSIIESPVDF